jgi:hypothetical protein
MLAFYSGPFEFSWLGPMKVLPAGSINIGLDVTAVPSPPSSIGIVDVCYTQKSEHTGLSNVLPRPRIAIGLGDGFSLEAMYLPPVTISEATANVGSVALAWTTPLSTSYAVNLTIRAHATFGEVQGPITCPRSALQQTDPTGVCWGNAPSKDTYRPDVAGAEVGVSSETGVLRWFGGAGLSSVMPRFQVGFTSVNGSTDNTKVHVDLTRFTLLYSVPQDVTTGRVGLSWRVR